MKAVATALACAMLAACSGGSSATPQPGPAPTPTPSPTPTPTPTPTPPPTYATYDGLAGDQNFQTTCTGFNFQTQPPASLPATAFGNGFLIAYAATPQTYSVTGDGLALSFGPGDIDPAAPTGVRAYLKAAPIGSDRFSISRPAPGTVPLDYARAANVSSQRSGFLRQYFCALGVPTLTTDLPDVTVGGGAYPRATLGASAYLRDTANARFFSTAKSTITIAADFSVNRVTVTMTIIGTPPVGVSGPDVPFGTFTGTATISRVTGNFSGTWTSSDRIVDGTFAGRFFGPQAKEVGMSFALFGPETGSQLAYSVAGTAFATR